MKGWSSLIPLLVVAGAGAAESPPPEKPADGSRLVCSIQTSAGSHIKKRVCVTEAQREARQKADQEALTKLTGPKSAPRSD